MPAAPTKLPVPREARNQRLDQFLAAQLPAFSRVQIQQSIRQGLVRVDGRAVRRPSLKLRGGERLEFSLAERRPLAAEPEDIPLCVLYEDADLAVIDKPAGLVVHAGAGRSRGTLVNALLHRFGKLSQVGGAVRPGIVHRLDQPTSGVLLVAKNDDAHRRLAEQFQRREVEKRYLALVHGRPAKTRGTIRLPVARDRVRRIRMTTRRPQGREAVTDYRVLESAAGLTLVEALLHTGRTHQIRVHFSALGHPVVGDTLYGAPRQVRWDNHSEPTLNRIFLHAHQLRFRHPRTQQTFEISAALPAELVEPLRRWGFKSPLGN